MRGEDHLRRSRGIAAVALHATERAAHAFGEQVHESRFLVPALYDVDLERYVIRSLCGALRTARVFADAHDRRMWCEDDPGRVRCPCGDEVLDRIFDPRLAVLGSGSHDEATRLRFLERTTDSFDLGGCELGQRGDAADGPVTTDEVLQVTL